MSSAEAWPPFLRQTWRDLTEAFPGRFAQSWRIALACALTAMMAAVYGIPEPAISCYLIFFVMKPDAAESCLLAVGLTVLVAIVVVLLFLFTRWTIDVPALRILAIAATSLVLLFLGSASKLGELGGIIALVIAFVLTLLDFVPFGEAATRGILYAWLMATMPMACVLGVNLFMGRKPVALLRQTVAMRLQAAAGWLERPDAAARQHLREQIEEGQEDALKRLGLTRLLALGRSAERQRLARALLESYRLTLALLALRQPPAPAQAQALARQIRAAAQALATGKPVPADTAGCTDPALAAASDALRHMAADPQGYPAQPPGDPFLRADAWRNPVHVRYAIKTTAAAIICYLAYTAFQWQGIHTAMITCYVAALGSVGETTHKLVLRISGCLVGAALGIGSILFLMPHLSTVGGLMLLVFFGTLLSAWIGVGNERVSYAGVQVALAFLLTVLQGSGPTFDMDTARDRIMGVLLGNCVMYVMFTQFWPVSVIVRARDSVRQLMGQLAFMAWPGGKTPQDDRDLRLAQASKVADNIAQTRLALGFSLFEVYRRRPSAAAIRRIMTIDHRARQLSHQLLLAPPSDDALAHRLQAMASPAETAAPCPPAMPAPAGTPAQTVQRLETLINGR
ncbi:FUSC family protein [Bordetella trematum]|uniref:FUSC family protein n=1 Tax=Bordetella trematum TaxID=123899 RepID=UPI0013FD7023|nr:FUSC family protein [Bordetella trematum]